LNYEALTRKDKSCNHRNHFISRLVKNLALVPMLHRLLATSERIKFYPCDCYEFPKGNAGLFRDVRRGWSNNKAWLFAGWKAPIIIVIVHACGRKFINYMRKGRWMLFWHASPIHLQYPIWSDCTEHCGNWRGLLKATKLLMCSLALSFNGAS